MESVVRALREGGETSGDGVKGFESGGDVGAEGAEEGVDGKRS